MIRVTVEDTETGEKETKEISGSDYFIVTTGDCRIDSAQTFANGTHTLVIKGRRP